MIMTWRKKDVKFFISCIFCCIFKKLRNFSRINLSCGIWGHTGLPCVCQLFRYAPKWPRMFTDFILQTATITCETLYDRDRAFMNASIIERIHMHWMLFWLGISISRCFSWTSA